jgi:heme exporter protein D
MSWASWSDFIAMGGYGGYVWSAYAVTFVFLAAEVVLVARRRRAALDLLSRYRESTRGER